MCACLAFKDNGRRCALVRGHTGKHEWRAPTTEEVEEARASRRALYRLPPEPPRIILPPSAAPAEPPPLLSKSLADLVDHPPEPVKEVVARLIPEATLAAAIGKPFGGKSVGAMNLAAHAISGTPFLPLDGDPSAAFAFPRPLRVLYVDEEMGEALFWNRIQKMRGGLSLVDPEALRRFRIASRKGLRFDDPKLLDAIRREIDLFDGGRPDLVVFDTLRRMHAYEENSSAEMAELGALVVGLQDAYRHASLVLHHTRKGVDDDDWREAARGSGDIVAGAQSLIGIAKPGDCLFNFRADAKHSGEVAPIALILDSTTLLLRRQTEEERFATKEAQHESAVKEAMAELTKTLGKLKDRGDYPPSWTTWRAKARGNQGTLTEARLRLQTNGTIVEAKRSGKGGGKCYAFPEDAETETRTGTRSEDDLFL
jgi:hypothetical protein